MQIHPARIYQANQIPLSPGPVFYWMQRDQRVEDNWALLFAQEEALKMNQPLFVFFCLAPDFLGASSRHYRFMLTGLERVRSGLDQLGIPFFLIHGDPSEAVPGILKDSHTGLLVTDFNPLRITTEWKKRVCREIRIPFVEVDTHNILPCRHISGKQEYSAFTLRTKINRQVSDFLTEIPLMKPMRRDDAANGQLTRKLLRTESERTFDSTQSLLRHDSPFPSQPAMEVLNEFIDDRLNLYSTNRNNPTVPGQSGLSPYLHFGQISAQRIALEIQKAEADPVSKQAFLEELIVRKELSDNYCFHNPQYDTFQGFPEWGQRTLNYHRDDERSVTYRVDQFDQSETHDALWNAAQREMAVTGKMHGYLRMYWAKKILEWSASPEEAVAIAVYLNDKYSLDGRDPNGYAGIAWSIGGVHDRPWSERPVFGMIRYMNEAGCRRKFPVDTYIKQCLHL